MSETSVQEKVTFEVVPQENHIEEMLNLPVVKERTSPEWSEFPGPAPEVEWLGGWSKTELSGVTPLSYAIRVLRLGGDESTYKESGEALHITNRYRNGYPVRWCQDRWGAVREIQHRYHQGRLSRAQVRGLFAQWETECVFAGSEGVPVPVYDFHHRACRARATCMPSRAFYEAQLTAWRCRLPVP